MDEKVITDSANRILESGVVGAVCVLLIVALVAVVKMWRSDLRNEQIAHQATRDAWRADVKEFADRLEKLGEKVTGAVQVAYDAATKARRRP